MSEYNRHRVNGLRNGYHTVVSGDGKYTGDFYNGKKHGIGCYTWLQPATEWMTLSDKSDARGLPSREGRPAATNIPVIDKTSARARSTTVPSRSFHVPSSYIPNGAARAKPDAGTAIFTRR